jgi:hypothetical protein
MTIKIGRFTIHHTPEGYVPHDSKGPCWPPFEFLSVAVLSALHWEAWGI